MDAHARTHTRSDVDDEGCVLRTRATPKARRVQFLIARMCRTIYVWEFFFFYFFFVAHLFKLCSGLLQWSPGAAPAPRVSLVYQALARLSFFFSSFAQISSYARMCASAFPCLFSGHFTVRAFGQKRQCGNARACARDTHKKETYACVRSPQPHRALAPPLSRTSAESPGSQMAKAHRQGHTVTRTDTQTHTGQDAERAQPGPKSTDELD